jgi:RNA polymerase sigma-70 factor (ECF subfamily)
MAEQLTSIRPSIDLIGLHLRRSDAVESWFRAYADALYTFVFYRVGRNEEVAADVAQETFVTALDKIESFDPERGDMLPWLTYIARNCIRKALRQHRQFATTDDLWDEVDRCLLVAFSTLAKEPLPDEVLERQETAELVRMALSNLPLRYQRAIEKRYFEQLSLRQIAAAEELTEGAVKSLLHRAKAAFQVAFESITETLADRGATERGLL